MQNKTQRHSPKCRRLPKRSKGQYRIRNWSEYNQALQQRGSLTVWLDQQTVSDWREKPRRVGLGAPRIYSDSAICCALTLQSIYHLPLRATQGLLTSLLQLMRLPLRVPHYSTLSRRRQTLAVNQEPLCGARSGSAVHLIVDSTGFKLLGEGEWKVRQHGWCRHRTWRKLHIGIDAETGKVVAAKVTTRQKTDKDVLAGLLDQVQSSLGQVTGDGGYDFVDCYQAILKQGGTAVIAPRCNARIHRRDKALRDRNRNSERIRELQGRRRKDPSWGRKLWKKESGYHQRSLVETTMFRIKTIFGDRVSSRSLPSQENELLLRCHALNRITRLGMPDTVKR